MNVYQAIIWVKVGFRKRMVHNLPRIFSLFTMALMMFVVKLSEKLLSIFRVFVIVSQPKDCFTGTTFVWSELKVPDGSWTEAGWRFQVPSDIILLLTLSSFSFPQGSSGENIHRARGHWEHSGQYPQIIFCLPKFCCTQKFFILFILNT